MTATTTGGCDPRVPKCDLLRRWANELDAAPAVYTLPAEPPYSRTQPPAAAGPHPDTPDRAVGAELDLDAIERRAATAHPQQLRVAGAMLPEAPIRDTIRAAIEAACRVAEADVPALVAEVLRLQGEVAGLARDWAAARAEVRRRVSPAADRVLDAAREWRRCGPPPMVAEEHDLAAAVDALDGDQPAEPGGMAGLYERLREPKSCPTCSGLWRETVGMVCQTCGTDYGSPPSAVQPAERALRAQESDITGHGSGVSAGQPAGPRARPELDAVAEQVAAAAGADAGHGPRLSALQAAARAAGGRLRAEVEPEPGRCPATRSRPQPADRRAAMRSTMIVAAVAVLALAGCAEASSEINTPDAWDSVQADPALIRGAERALADAPPPAEGWAVGVVLAEQPDEWAITAMTDTGIVYLDDNAGRPCDWEPPSRYAILIDPGDLITWSLKGDDEHLCIDEIEVLRKAAARLGGDDDA